MALLPPRVSHPRCLVVLTVVTRTPGPAAPGTPLPAWTAVPRSIEIVRNDARTADTATLTLDWRDFPIDARAVDGVHVSVHVENAVDPRLPLIPSPVNLRFVGFADRVETRHEDGSDVVIACRDYTGIGLARRWAAAWPSAPAPAPPTPFPVVGTLQSVVEAIRVLCWPLTQPALFLDPVAAASPVAVRLGRSTWTARADDTVWDVLSEVCGLFGQVPVWHLDRLEIRPPVWTVRKPVAMKLGWNVSKLATARDLGLDAAKPVKVVAWDPGTGVALETYWPAVPAAFVAQPGVAGLPGAAGARLPAQDYVQYSVEGRYTPPDLVLLAQLLYTELAANRLTGTVETSDLTDASGAGLLSVQHGTPLVVLGGQLSELSSILEGSGPAAAIAWLTSPARPSGPLRPDVATALVSAWSANAMASVLFVTRAVHRWDHESGYRLTMDFGSYILS